MANPTPETLAKEFARRWFAHESSAVREIGERELLQMIRVATGQAKPSNDQGRAA